MRLGNARSYLSYLALLIAAVSPAQADDGTVRASVARESRHPFEVGGILGVHVFADDIELGVHDQRPRIEAPKSFALLGARFGFSPWRRLAMEAEAVAIPTSDGMSKRITVLGWRVHALAEVARLGRARPFVLAGAGGLTAFGSGNNVNTVASDTDAVPYWGGGVKLAFGKRLIGRLDVRHLLPPDTTVDGVTHDIEVHASVGLQFGAASSAAAPVVTVADTDNDGLTDDNDRCPKEAEDKDGFEDEDGCPDPDDDLDGIADAGDRCPRDAETRNGIDDEDGCPEKDPDQDGLVGTADQCPTDPEDKDAFLDEDGCPDPDNDADGVADAADRCPREPEDKDSFQDDDGCPDPDNDGDGIPDSVDACPNEAETFNGREDDDGCPDKGVVLVVLTADKVEIKQQVNFPTNKAKIKRSSYTLLATIAKILLLHPEITKVRIEGHTDSAGSDAKNLRLSQARADAVRRHLIEVNGIEAARLESVGRGETQPIADNTTKAGKAANRRSEFVIVERAQ